MAQVQKQFEKTVPADGADQNQPDKHFPPRRERMGNAKDRWELISREMERHQDVLAELADS